MIQDSLNAPTEACASSSWVFSDARAVEDPIVRFSPTVAGERGDVKKIKSNSPVVRGESAHGLFLKPADLIWLEISLVPQVEAVYVQAEGNGAYDVVTIINENDDEVRRRIYQREGAIIDMLNTFEFSFRVVSRAGLPENEIISSEAPAYRR
jgi:hypothetical protein